MTTPAPCPHAAQLLTRDGQALIPPATATTPAHTIVMLVRADQIPGGDIPSLAAKIRDAGVIPAGHALQIREATNTWDGWETAAGTTWDEVDAKTKTWAEVDSLGINLEG